MKTLDEVEPRIPIPGSVTPAPIFVIDEPGSYYLEGDRNCGSLGIHVTAGDVTIDLMGYALIGTDSGSDVGIGISSGTNIEIRNGTVRDFGGMGIYAGSTAVKDVRMIGLRAVSNGGDGLSVVGVGGLIKDCTASENGGRGIRTARSYTVSGCIVRQNGEQGIHSGHGNTVVGNTCFLNGDDGIETGYGCTIEDNTVVENMHYGIYAGKGCTIIGNTAYNHANAHGIFGHDGSTLKDNTSYNNYRGIYASLGCTVMGNTAYLNNAWGIYVLDDSLVGRNTAFDNDQIGSGYDNLYTGTSCTVLTNHAP
jgi:parallel beta-helix repeat protein